MYIKDRSIKDFTTNIFYNPIAEYDSGKKMSKSEDLDPITDYRNKTKVSHLARLFQILTDTYGQKKQMNALRKLEGEEISAYFPRLGNRYASLKSSDAHLIPFLGKSNDPVAIIEFNLSSDDIVPVINDVIRTPANLIGVLKLSIKYILSGKIKLRGSLMKAILFLKTIMIGKHPMYVKERESYD